MRRLAEGLSVTSGDAQDGYWKLRPNAPASGQILDRPDTIADESAREFVFGRGRSAFRMFVVRRGAQFRGYLNICPHFSLPLNHAPDQFLKDGFIECAQHFARFDVEQGRCVSGACEGEWLARVPIAIDADGLLVVA